MRILVTYTAWKSFEMEVPDTTTDEELDLLASDRAAEVSWQASDIEFEELGREEDKP